MPLLMRGHVCVCMTATEAVAVVVAVACRELGMVGKGVSGVVEKERERETRRRLRGRICVENAKSSSFPHASCEVTSQLSIVNCIRVGVGHA